MASDVPPCKAYKSLDDKLKEQCKRYLLFHQNKKFGAFPGMYKDHGPDYEGEKKPDERTSHYFRGGIISTMAVFEAFIQELLEEACTDDRLESNKKGKKSKGFNESQTKSDKKGKAGGKGGTSGEGAGKGGEGGEGSNDDDADAKDTITLEEKYKKWKDDSKQSHDRANIVKFHKWSGLYAKFLIKKGSDKINSFIRYLFCHPMNYSYVIQNYDPQSKLQKTEISEIKIGVKPAGKQDTIDKRCERRERRTESMEDESIICALLRLFYGIRCVMAHGDPDRTLNENALKDFPGCPDCHGKRTQNVLDDASDLESYCLKIIKATGGDQLGRIPKKQKFKKIEIEKKDCLKDNEWEDVYKILCLHFSSNPDANPLPAPFAFFHMCRVDQWLRENKIDMHITYRMLVRINQFIHMLAFRLTIAVATILEEEHRLPSGSWGIQEPGVEGVIPITKDEISNMIKRFEDRHEKIVHLTKETNLTGQEGEDEITKICKEAQEIATKKLKGNEHFMTTPNGVWRVIENEEKIDDNCVLKTYISVVKEAN